MIEYLTNRLYTKLKNEYMSYIENIKKLPPEKIIENSYNIAIRQEFVDMFYGTSDYNKYELKILLEKENTLDFLYEDWCDSDGGIHSVLEERLDSTLYDLTEEFENEFNIKLESDPNCELIKNISDSLCELNNYSFCTHLKDKYHVTDLDEYDVYEILNSNDGGAFYLYSFFDELKDDEHLLYLNEISVINSESVNNIEEKILPKLKEIVKNQENNKQQSKEINERDER